MPISTSFVGKNGQTISVTVEDSARQRCEIWSRVIGYYQVRDQYNAGKVSEFRERVFYAEPEPHLLQPQLPGTD